MEVRSIDAIELQQKMCALCNQDYSDEPCEPSDCVFIRAINEMPTLTPPNEPLALELVAEILAEQFGDECACNFNGNDEWLPMMCHYGDVCPDPPEHLGCWMELLRNKYCRPPEGGDADHA